MAISDRRPKKRGEGRRTYILYFLPLCVTVPHFLLLLCYRRRRRSSATVKVLDERTADPEEDGRGPAGTTAKPYFPSLISCQSTNL